MTTTPVIVDCLKAMMPLNSDDPLKEVGLTNAHLMFIICTDTSKALDGGLRNAIDHTIMNMKPYAIICVDYIRLGYDQEVRAINPIVILITVEEDKVLPIMAQQIVDEVYHHCCIYERADLHVELIEGHREPIGQAGHTRVRVIDDYPHIGCAIGPADHEFLSGTLGGFLSVDGRVMGLTNHHVLFQPDNTKAYLLPTDMDTMPFKGLRVNQPSIGGVKKLIEEYEYRISDLEIQKKAMLSMALSSSNKSKNRVLDLEMSLVKSQMILWQEQLLAGLDIGSVVASSGLPSIPYESTNPRLDWAVFAVDEMARGLPVKSLVNKARLSLLRRSMK